MEDATGSGKTEAALMLAQGAYYYAVWSGRTITALV